MDNQNQNSHFTVKKKSTYRGLFRAIFLPLAVAFLSLLGGCVQYDVSIDFFQQHQGEIVQHIRLAEQLTNLSQTEANKWLDSLEQRAEKLQGKAKRISPQEIVVKIPFGNGKQLTKKFNQFFNPPTAKFNKSINNDDLDLVNLKAKMALQQSNWLFLERNKLNLEVDLRALGVLSNQGNIIVSPGSLVDLEFVLKAPFGLKNIVSDTPVSQGINQLVWALKPGQINTIEASFWVPSYLGIGTVVIILLMLGGFYIKYRHFPGVKKSIDYLSS